MDAATTAYSVKSSYRARVVIISCMSSKPSKSNKPKSPIPIFTGSMSALVVMISIPPSSNCFGVSVLWSPLMLSSIGSMMEIAPQSARIASISARQFFLPDLKYFFSSFVTLSACFVALAWPAWNIPNPSFAPGIQPISLGACFFSSVKSCGSFPSTPILLLILSYALSIPIRFASIIDCESLIHRSLVHSPLGCHISFSS